MLGSRVTERNASWTRSTIFLRKHNVFTVTLSPCYAKLMCSCKKAARKSKNTLEKDSGGKSGGLHCVYRQKDVRTCTSLISCENECVLPDCSAGVKGNLIRAHTDPGGMNPPAESVRRIGSTSGFNPSSRKCKHTVKKIHLEMMCLS